MRKILLTLTGAVLLQIANQTYASNINVILSGEVQPGVYGQVQIGDARPRVVYARPVVIREVREYRRQPPIYLHVPPGHARNWSQHCRYYDACGRKVYFVKSREYDVDYQREYRRNIREERHHDRYDRHDDRRDDRYDRHHDRHDYR